MKASSLAMIGYVVLAAQTADAQFGSAPAELDVIEVREDVYVIHNELVPGNVTALITDEGVILVDDKYEIDHDNLVAMLRTVTDQPVKYVINTHFHDDHSGGNAKLQAGGTLALASAEARARMIAGNQSGLPNVTIEPKGSIHLGGKSAEIYWFGRAHTDGDVVVLFPESRVLAAGDMFTVGPGLPQLVDYGGGGSAKAWTATLDEVLKLDFDTVVPGHGEIADKRALQAYRQNSERLTDVVTTLVRRNRSRAEIEAVLRSEFGFEDFHIGLSLDGLIAEMR